MSAWAREHPEEYAEIAALPLNQQNAALRAAIGYDPDAIRDRYEESQTECPSCGAPADADCSGPCKGEQGS